MTAIQIVTAANDRYAKPLGVMLCSLLENKSPSSKMVISVIDGHISEPNKIRLKQLANQYSAKLRFLPIDTEVFAGFKEKKHFTKETYYRILIPSLMKKSTRKALYLDPDVIVKTDISRLWNKNIDDYYLAAVEKAYMPDKRKKDLDIPDKSGYFTAGVMLLNLHKWRKRGISGKVLRYIRNHDNKIKFCSQDPLNAILHNKWKKVHPRWNYSTDYIKRRPDVSPAIIHFTGSKKPWNEGHPLEREYHQYARLTGWD